MNDKKYALTEKKYITRTDLKVAGFQDLFFYGNLENGYVGLKAHTYEAMKDGNYKVFWDVTCERLGTSARNIERLCRLMLEEYEKYSSMKVSDKRLFIEENGIKI